MLSIEYYQEKRLVSAVLISTSFRPRELDVYLLRLRCWRSIVSGVLPFIKLLFGSLFYEGLVFQVWLYASR